MNILAKIPYVKNADNTSHKSATIVFSNVLVVFQANMSTLKFFTFSDFTLLENIFSKKRLFFDQNFRNFFSRNFRSRNRKFFFPSNLSRNFPTFQRSYSRHWRATFLCFLTYLGPFLKVSRLAFFENHPFFGFLKVTITKSRHVRYAFYFF